MKNFVLHILLLYSILTGCSRIQEDERLIYVKPVAVNHKILIEDFTGQRCVNCPNASDEILRLQELYGEDALIVVSIHSGPLGFHTNSHFLGLSTNTGDIYYTHWGVEYLPIGMVNRSKLLSPSAWSAQIRDELQQKASVDIHVATELEGHKLSIRTEVLGIDGNTKGKLQLWVVEDSITAFQLMPDGTRCDDYIHRHVFRTAINGTWGEDINMKEGEQIIKEHNDVILADEWDINHLSIVAFVYDNNHVKQINQVKLKN